jgi:putative selenate reductase
VRKYWYDAAMAELAPIPFEQLLRRVLEEPARQGTLFDLPLKKAWRPSGKVDLSVAVHGRRAQTPVGPAAGPHAQLAQNIVLSWLGGSRVIELKTVQVLDQLKIGRPCIDAATVGFNVEWSQELSLDRSLIEYVAGWMLLRILRHLDPIGLGEAARDAEPVFELSVGYDLKGLQSPSLRRYLQGVKDVGIQIAQLRDQIPAKHQALRDLDFRREMVHCVTLSTFHGCPAGEIEAIANYLLDEHDVDVIVKLNPTLLGFDEVRYLLQERMGYHELRPKKEAFEGDLRWEEAIAMARRLSSHAEARGRHFGVKMTNTLVVENHKKFFAEREMYLSGAPLHVLAMTCVERWRAAFGAAIPISFSGGIDQHNFADAVACDLVPVTTCTDLLRPGGYGRLPRYLGNLEEAMIDCRARDRSDFILRRFSVGAEAVRNVFADLREEGERFAKLAPAAREGAEKTLAELEAELRVVAKSEDRSLFDAIASFSARPDAAPVAEWIGDLHGKIVAAAGVLNSHVFAAQVTGDPRYAAGKNGKPPRKVGSQLVLLDCLSCDKCVPVCPNDANFAIETPLEEIAFEDFTVDDAGAIARAPGGIWKVAKPEQWANFADACNECGNCDVFCPEDGGPYVMKARFFGSLASFEASPALDGMLIDESDGALRVRARVDGRPYQLMLASSESRLEDGRLAIDYDLATGAVKAMRAVGEMRGAHRLSGKVFLTLRALVRGALASGKLNPVSAAIQKTWFA